MSQDGSARSDLPAGGQEELGGVSYSERMKADMMEMLANRTMQNQQLLQQHLQQQQQTAAGSSRRPRATAVDGSRRRWPRTRVR